MTRPYEPGSASPQQIAKFMDVAKKANLPRNYLTAMVMDRRNRTRLEPLMRDKSLSQVLDFRDLSMDECSTLITELTAIAGGEERRDICGRCARIGLVYDDSCLHDTGFSTDRDEAVREHERRRGLRSW